jgi:hypothetical protein
MADVAPRFRGSSPQQPFQEQNERNNQRHNRQPQEQRMNGTGTRAHHFSSAAKNALNNHRSPIRTKAASEQSSPNSEKIPRKLRELMKRSAGFMAKASAMMRIVQPAPKLLVLMRDAQEVRERKPRLLVLTPIGKPMNRFAVCSDPRAETGPRSRTHDQRRDGRVVQIGPNGLAA